MLRVTPLLATTLLAAPALAQDVTPFNPAEQTQTYQIEVTRPGEAPTIRDDATPAPDASATMDSNAPAMLDQSSGAAPDNAEKTSSANLTDVKPAPDAAATLGQGEGNTAFAPVPTPNLGEISPALGDGATLPDGGEGLDPELSSDPAPSLGLNGAPVSAPSDAKTSASDEDSDVRVGLPVAEDVSPQPIAPADPAQLDALLGYFSEEPKQFTQQDGGALYDATCAACHMPDAKGAEGAGAYPPLAGNPKMISPYYIATVLLTGYHGMPRFGNTMDDAQIAAVTNYVRSHFGNAFEGEITAEDVGQLRAP